MAKDYAKKIKPSMRKPKKSNHEGRLWLLVCVLAGLFIAGLLYLKLQKSKVTQQPTVAVSPQNGRTAVKANASSQPKSTPQPKFDFYTMLPNGNSSASTEKQDAEAAQSAEPTQQTTQKESSTNTANSRTNNEENSSSTTSNSTPSTTDEVAALEKQQLAEESGNSEPSPPKNYIVQLAIFHNVNAANQFKAQMAMLGLEVKVKSSANNNYRVIMGPFKSKSDANSAQQQLKNNKIYPGVIRATN